LYPFISKIRAAFVDLAAVGADELALSPLEADRPAIVARLGGLLDFGFGRRGVDGESGLDERFRMAGLHDEQ
jgi:hypothetical protein